MTKSIASALAGMAAAVALLVGLSFTPRVHAADAVPPTRMITADTDLSRLEVIHATQDEKPALVPCKLPPKYADKLCLKVVKGPFVVTDVTWQSGELSMFVAPSDSVLQAGYTPHWHAFVGNQFTAINSAVGFGGIHGTRYPVRADETLYIADPPVALFRTVTVSGFRPY